MRWKLVSILLLGVVVLSFISSVAAGKSEDSWEEWAKEHTVRVLVVEELTYKNGELVKRIEYTGDKLKAKFGVNKLSRVEKVKIDMKTLAKLYPLEAHSLGIGKTIKRIYYKTTVITTSDDPFQWWKSYPYLPRWTWKKLESCGYLICHIYYEKADPVNIVWEGGTKSEVKEVLGNAGWYDWVVASSQYIYDPPQYGGSGWEEGDDMATTRTLGPRYHIRLWVIYNGKVIGSAHYEDRDHDVISFEQAEEKVWSYYSSPWVITPDYYYLYNYISNPYNDGYATKIKKTSLR
ncbi:hypothetical protein FH039_09615 [Thermococcus indicus]|uniref:Uncharacterized protein n=1 Tax=Thermococcus indicus TaxID=2586643 RepID=A0A4Y5SLM1_9EURY|nr:hypothetical protein [Thermococcus indicus]QDA31803.1 hypothetical protein FH039_09615 [Thermococcus indicus]